MVRGLDVFREYFAGQYLPNRLGFATTKHKDRRIPVLRHFALQNRARCFPGAHETSPAMTSLVAP